MTTRKPRYGDIFAGHDEGAAMAEQANILWETYKSDLVDRGLWNAARGLTTDRLVRASVQYHLISPIAIAEGPVTKGPNGGDVFNFKWSTMEKLDDRISKLEKSLTLTPESVGAKVEGSGGEKQIPKGASKYLDRAKAH